MCSWYEVRYSQFKIQSPIYALGQTWVTVGKVVIRSQVNAGWQERWCGHVKSEKQGAAESFVMNRRWDQEVKLSEIREEGS